MARTTQLVRKFSPFVIDGNDDDDDDLPLLEILALSGFKVALN